MGNRTQPFATRKPKVDLSLRRCVDGVTSFASLRFRNCFPLKKPLQLLFTLLACLHLVGGPYSFLQVCAWAGMLVSYSQDGGVIQAVTDTFSGEKPCKLCCKIAAARDSDKEAPAPVLPVSVGMKALVLKEILPASQVCLKLPVFSELQAVVFPGVLYSLGRVAVQPPTPPPRRIA